MDIHVSTVHNQLAQLISQLAPSRPELGRAEIKVDVLSNVIIDGVR
jgi:hypothetical protein